MEIESLFKKKSLEDIVDSCLAWFQRGEKTPEEVSEWLKAAYNCNLLAKNDSIPLVLLDLICQKLNIEENIAREYMKTAAKFCIGQPKNTAPIIIDAVNRKLGIEASEFMKIFLQEFKLNSRGREETMTDSPVSKEIERQLAAPIDQALKRTIFLKGALAGLVLGVCLTLAVGAITGPGKSTEPETGESLPPASSSMEVTEEATESESQTQPQQITKIAAVFSESGTVKIRIGPSRNYQTVALVYGKSRLPFRIGDTVKDDSGDTMIWTEIYLDDYTEKEQNDFEILDKGYVEEGRVYYIASQFLVDVEE